MPRVMKVLLLGTLAAAMLTMSSFAAIPAEEEPPMGEVLEEMPAEEEPPPPGEEPGDVEPLEPEIPPQSFPEGTNGPGETSALDEGANEGPADRESAPVQDSGTPEQPGEEGTATEAEAAVIQLAREFHLFVYGLIPIGVAVFIFYRCCMWFYKTFIEEAF